MPRTKKAAPKKADRTPVLSARVPMTTQRLLGRIGDEIGGGASRAIEYATYRTAKELGLLDDDVAADIASLERDRGPDKQIAAVILEEPTAEGLIVGVVAAVVDGEQLPDWQGALLAKQDDDGVFWAEVLIKHTPSDVAFDLGTIRAPKPDNALVTRIRDLPELRCAPTDSDDPREARRELRETLGALRRLFPQPETDEEPPLDDD